MSEPFTIHIFVANGDPEGVRLVDRMNWTGVGVVFPREQWKDVCKSRPELGRTGVYVLVGYKEGDEDLPTLYVGEGDVVANRIESHAQTKEFWEQGYVFTTSNNGLNKAHVRWSERELIQQAKKAGRSKLHNGIAPPEPPLSEAERADKRAFLREILQILPIMGLRAFEEPRPVASPHTPAAQEATIGMASPTALGDTVDDVVIVPAQEEGFKAVFMGEKRWRAIHIAGGKLQRIRYIAVYQTKPVSAVTHYAAVEKIEPYGEGGKYQLIFSAPPIEVGPIPFGNAPAGIGSVPIAPVTARLIQASSEGLDHGGVVLVERNAVGGDRAAVAPPGRQASGGRSQGAERHPASFSRRPALACAA